MTKAKGKKKNAERRRNYVKGRFGSRNNGRNYGWWERRLIMIHIVPDRWLARLFDSSTNGIQIMRWRIKVNYKGMYRS